MVYTHALAFACGALLARLVGAGKLILFFALSRYTKTYKFRRWPDGVTTMSRLCSTVPATAIQPLLSPFEMFPDVGAHIFLRQRHTTGDRNLSPDVYDAFIGFGYAKNYATKN